MPQLPFWHKTVAVLARKWHILFGDYNWFTQNLKGKKKGTENMASEK